MTRVVCDSLCFGVVVATSLALLGCPSKPPPKGPDLDSQLKLPPPRMPAKPTGTIDADVARLHTIDIGQGLALLVEFPCGVVLYDTGGEDNGQYNGVPLLLEYLDAFFDRRPELGKTIDLLVLSHPHIDHTRAVEQVLGRYTVRNVVDNGADVDDLGGKPQMALHRWIASKDDAVPYFAVKRGAIVDAAGLTNDIIDPIGGCDAAPTDPKIRALWGGTDLPPELGQNANNDSVVLRIDYGKSSFLLPGDLEIVGWAKMTKKLGVDNPVFDVDAYVVGHHGSKNATIEYQTRIMSPKVAVFSSGPFSRYLKTEVEFTAHVFAHPNAKALQHLTSDDHGVSMWRAKPIRAWVGIKGRWKESKAVWEEWVIRRAVYGTAWDGTVVVSGNANGFMDVATELPETKWVPAAQVIEPQAATR